MAKSIFYIRESLEHSAEKRTWFIHRRDDGSYFLWPARRGAKTWTSRERVLADLPGIQSEVTEPLEVHEHIQQKIELTADEELRRLFKL